MKFFTTKLAEIIFAVSASLLAVILALVVAGSQYASTINSALNVTTYRTESVDDGTVVDTEYYKATYSSDSALKADYAALCEEVEAEGIVLLKNDNDALPLNKGSKVSLFGQGAVSFNYASSGSSATSSTSSYATLKDALEYDGRMTVNPTLWNFYTSGAYSSSTYGRSYSSFGYTINEAPYDIYTDEVKTSYSIYGDAAIVVLARDSGEGSDSSTTGSDGLDGSYLSISQTEYDLLIELTKLKNANTFKNIIVILNSALNIQLDFLGYDGIDVDACLWVGNTGSHGAYAIGAVLTGEVNPSGRTVDTYLNDNFSSPAMASWAANANKKFTQSYSNYKDYSLKTTNRYYGVYVEGIYVGYRYYETRYEDYVMGTGNAGDYDYSADVAYSFGYGLSYSDFTYSNYEVTADGDTYTVSVDVTNNSKVPGKEVVQIYLQKPYTQYDQDNGIEKASVELVGYAKTAELDEGDTETVEIEVDKEQFKTYDSNGYETYILDEGTYYLTAAKNAHDAVNNILAAKGYTTGDGMDDGGNADLVEVALEQSSLDTSTYSVSTETGEKITNQFDFADVNRYEGSGSNSVTYVSRSDWEGTFPTANISLSVATEQMATDLQSNNEVEEDGSEMPTYGASNGLTLIMLRGLDYDDDSWDDLLDQMTYAEQSYLITDGKHMTRYISSVVKPATADENGPTSVDGSVTGYCLPSEGIWAASFNDELIERVGNLMGDDCIMAGIQGLYAPGVNIHRTPFGGRAHEYFSEDSYLTAMASVAEIKGIQDRGVVAYVKHLAFNNEETNRNGVCVWLNEQSAREIYLMPFEYSMRPSMGNAHATMTSFNRAGCIWTSASSELMLNVIREEWDFDGFAITDMADSNGDFMTYYDGIMNGTNLYDGEGGETKLDSYSSSARFANMMRESCHRILYVVCNYSAAMNGYSSNTIIIPVTPWWQTLLTVLEVVAIVLVVCSVAIYVAAIVLKRKKPANGGDPGGTDTDVQDIDRGAENKIE